VKEKDKDPRFEVREYLELHMHWGQRRIRIYFTDIAVYIVEYYTGIANYIWPVMPYKIILTPILAKWYKKDFDKMTDIRVIMSTAHWHRRYAYDEIKRVWFKEGKGKKNAIFFKIVRKNKGIVTPGFGSGTDYLTFDAADTEEFKEVLKRRMGRTFKGFR
jgi:hypothetical protein